MQDRCGREIEYLRLSVTQACDLNCIYCQPASPDSGESLCIGLSPQEFEIIVRAMAGLGIKKVRLTGGEPLTRSDIGGIVAKIACIPGIDDLSMTTNGTHLKDLAEDLKTAGLNRINISLDSLRPERFRRMTGGGSLDQVVAGIMKAIAVGLHPVKLNTVLIRGMNDDEVEDFVSFAHKHPVQVRFIELMPIGKFGEDNRDKTIFNREIIARHPELNPVAGIRENGPAYLFSGDGFQGLVGFISPMSHQFCDRCNRIRVTCDGKLKPCLGDNGEVDIMNILRQSPERLAEVIAETILNKPAGHHFQNFKSQRSMKSIGG